ncbi:hypothetical protein [Actinomycetospora soli]|uniref:hypothetical protein n=1 Tax=Actinomycetospora soli TaxID=2893887 RepID=UPI001E566E7F|nr:hypothetical protein [Actinomycetospora soli]MCD2188029.1 hypothetical protein [Actinomycetospora soli]
MLQVVLSVVVVAAAVVALTVLTVLGVRAGRRERRAEEAAWLAGSAAGDGEPVTLEVWWAGREAGVVWDGRDVGTWRPNCDGPSDTPRLKPVQGGLATTAEPMSLRRGALLAERDHVEVGGRRFLLLERELVDSRGTRWPLSTLVFAQPGEVRRWTVPRELGPRGALLVLDRLALRGVAAASSGD